MSKYSIDSSTLSSIGDAIRSKEGSSSSILVANFADRILALPVGGKQYKILANAPINNKMGLSGNANQIQINCANARIQSACPGFIYLRELLLDSLPDNKLQGFHFVIPFIPFKDEDISTKLSTYMPISLDINNSYMLDLNYLVEEDGAFTKTITPVGSTVAIQIDFPNVHYVHNNVIGTSSSSSRFYNVQSGKTNDFSLYWRSNTPNAIFFTGLSSLKDNTTNVSINKGTASTSSMYGAYFSTSDYNENYTTLFSDIITVEDE